MRSWSPQGSRTFLNSRTLRFDELVSAGVSDRSAILRSFKQTFRHYGKLDTRVTSSASLQCRFFFFFFFRSDAQYAYVFVTADLKRFAIPLMNVLLWLPEERARGCGNVSVWEAGASKQRTDDMLTSLFANGLNFFR